MDLRRKAMLVALALMTLALLAPTIAGAHHPNPNANCASAAGDSEAEMTIPSDDMGILYIDTEADYDNSAATPGVYLETNGYPGLQTHSHSCDGQTVPGDAGLPGSLPL